MRYNVLLFGLAIGLLSCQPKPKKIYIDYSATTDTTELDLSDNTISAGSEDIPFREDGGIKIVPVQINGLKLDMIFDTGCSTTSISVAEANYLYQKGLLTPEDVLGEVSARVADGRIVPTMVINLKEVVLGEQLIFHNVEATVSDNMQAPLLLGNEVLNRVASYTIDNDQKVIHVKLL